MTRVRFTIRITGITVRLSSGQRSVGGDPKEFVRPFFVQKREETGVAGAWLSRHPSFTPLYDPRGFQKPRVCFVRPPYVLKHAELFTERSVDHNVCSRLAIDALENKQASAEA